MVACSLVLLGLAVYLGSQARAAVRLVTRGGLSAWRSLSCTACSSVCCRRSVTWPRTLRHADQFGYARAATETPQPITNILSTPSTVDGKTFAPGQIVYPGFDADVLWKFRWYSIINQALIWAGSR